MNLVTATSERSAEYQTRVRSDMVIGTQETKRKYDRYSKVYNLLEFPLEKMILAKWRKNMLSKLQGKILEVGVGTGKNLKHYGSHADVTGIDISDGMLRKAFIEAGRLHRDFKLLRMDAQNMTFEDNSFDYVVCTFVLCSVPDPVKSLKEMKRVVKKNGQIIMLEHVLSKNKLIALWQNIHNPITRALFGFNVNRDTRSNITKAGIHIKEDLKLGSNDVFRRFECTGGRKK